MERKYELALERIQELEEKYIDLKAEYEFLKDQCEYEEEKATYHLKELMNIYKIAYEATK